MVRTFLWLLILSLPLEILHFGHIWSRDSFACSHETWAQLCQCSCGTGHRPLTSDHSRLSTFNVYALIYWTLCLFLFHGAHSHFYVVLCSLWSPWRAATTCQPCFSWCHSFDEGRLNVIISLFPGAVQYIRLLLPGRLFWQPVISRSLWDVYHVRLQAVCGRRFILLVRPSIKHRVMWTGDLLIWSELEAVKTATEGHSIISE